MAEKTPAPATTIAEYSPTAEALAELRQKYELTVFDTKSKKGMEEAKAARAELRTLRVALEAKRVEIKNPALTRCREIDSEAKRITAELAALEDPIDDAIKAEEQRVVREREAKEQAERDRIAEVNRRFDELKRLTMLAAGKTVDQIEALLLQADGFDVSNFPEDLQAAAKFERQLAINGLKALRDQRIEQDRREARLEELERQDRERKAAEQAETDRKAAEEAERIRQREAAEAQERAQAEATRQEELRQREAEIAERERVAAAERAEADRVAMVERDRIAAEQAEKHRAAEAAAQAERDRLAAERKRLDEEAARLAAEKEQREIANASLIEAASECLPLLKDGYPRHKATKKLAAALAREQRQAA